jgi:hypothetical protein
MLPVAAKTLRRSLYCTLSALLMATILAGAGLAEPPAAPSTPGPPLRPATVCTERPVWDSPPSNSGTVGFGNTITASSGNVFCANSLRATFYWTNSVGTILGTAKTGVSQNCSNVGFIDCSKTDTYKLSTADQSYYIKVVWTAVNFLGQVQNSPPLLGPLPAMTSIKYAVHLNGIFKMNYTVRFPGCGLGALCANVSSGVEPQPDTNGTCQQWNVAASQWSATGGSKDNLTQNPYEKSPPGHYTGLVISNASPTSWTIAASNNGGTTCGGNLNAQYYAVADQGVSHTQGLPPIITGPPLTERVGQLSYTIMQAQNGIIFVPALWAIGDFAGTQHGSSWIEVGIVSGISCTNMMASKTYTYVEAAAAADTGLHCVTPSPACDGCATPIGQWTSTNGTRNIYFFTEVAAGSQNVLELKRPTS